MHLPADRASYTLDGERSAGAAAGGLRLSVVILAYNERECVAAVTTETCRLLENTELDPFEVIVVDDGSTDGTSELLDQLAAHEPRVRVVHRGRNGGYGAAVKSGYAVAQGALVIAIPADGQCPPAQILELAGALGDADLVASGRLHEGKASSRRTLTNGWILLTRLILGFDPTGIDGIYLIRRSVLAGLPIKSDTGLVNFEVLWRCTRQQRRIARHVLPIAPRRGGESKVTNLRTIARIVGEMIWLRLRG